MLNVDESESLSESSCSSDEEVGPKKRFKNEVSYSSESELNGSCSSDQEVGPNKRFTIEKENERFKSEVSYSSESELNGSNSSDQEAIPRKRPRKEFTESDEEEISEQKGIMAESEELEQENSSSSDYEEAVPKTQIRRRKKTTINGKKNKLKSREYDSSSSDDQEIRINQRSRRIGRVMVGKEKSSSTDDSTSAEHEYELLSTSSESSPRKKLSDSRSVMGKRRTVSQSAKSDDFHVVTGHSAQHISDQAFDEIEHSPGNNRDGDTFNAVPAHLENLPDSEASNEDSNTATQTEESITESSDSISESSCEVDQSDESSSWCGKQSGFSSEDDLSECDFPVWQGTNVRRKTFEAALLALSIKHNFSKSTRTDIFKFLKTFLPKPNLPSSNYVFGKNLVDSMSIHYSKCELCVNCSTATSDGKRTNRHCTHFNRKLNDHDIEICYFIPIKDQLERILTEHWVKIVEYKSEHVHSGDQYYDICCGEVYQGAEGKDDPRRLISLVYHIDGAPAVKSKSMNLWPIQCFVVELPPKLRYSFPNILVCGLSCTPKKPDLKVFQDKFVNELESLQHSQVQLVVGATNISIHRICLHGHLADLVAKAPSLCFSQFNGESRWSICLHPGERIQQGKGSIRIYPYRNQEPPQRTHAQTLVHARRVERTGKSVCGVKGLSPLLCVLNVPSQILLDYMHLVLAGEFLKRLNAWLDQQSGVGFLAGSKEEIDHAILNIKFPHDFNRKLRMITELKRWKDRELQNLFLHASLPILKPFLPDDYFCHFALFVTSIRLLTNDSISNANIEIAKLLIRSYQCLMPKLYEEKEQTYTCHALGHLPNQVRNHGPLILHSSFVFEAMISHLKRQFHGTRGIVGQIVRNLLLAQNSGSLVKKETKEPQEVRSFIEETITAKKDKNLHEIGENCFLVLPFTNNPQLPNSLVQYLNLREGSHQVHQANRMYKDDQVFHSLAYRRRGQSCSYIVQFQEHGSNEFGIVKHYLLVKNEGFAVICKFQKKGNICSFDLEEQEDLMIKSFIDKDVRLSPYAVSTDVNKSTTSNRPKSAVLSERDKFKRSAGPPRPVIGWAEKSDWKAREQSSKQGRRPVSAPAVRNRSGSFSSATSSLSRNTGTSASSAGSGKKSKPLYKRKPSLICVRAFQNGNRDNYARITVPDLQQLLDTCTEKLGLVSAARKVFLSDGTPVTQASQLQRDVDVFVSCGEAFRDPYATIRDREELRRSASWTLGGIVLPEDRSRGRTKPSLSKRMKSLVESQKRRILVFRNGESSEGVEIVAGRFDEFLDDCTEKLKLESGARLLFDWEGKEIKSFSDVPILDRILQPSVSVILGPVWVTRGAERFSPKGAYHFIATLLLSTKDRLKQSKTYKQQLEQSLKGEEVVSKEIMAMTQEEIENELKEVDHHISDLANVVPTLESHLSKVESGAQEEESAGLENYRYQHLTQITSESRLLGKQGLKLKVYENGSVETKVDVHFNLQEAERGIQGDNSRLMNRFLDACTNCQKVTDSAGGPAGSRIAKRVFTRDGQEITDVHDLSYGQEIWLSYGEDFKPLHVVCLELSLDKASCVSLWGEKEMVQREIFDSQLEGKGKEKASLWKAVNGFPKGSKRHLVGLYNPGSELSQAKALQEMRVDENGCFLQYKEYKNLVLYPEISVGEKKKKGATSLWPPDTQEWVITQSGLIHSKAMPQLVLSCSDHTVSVEYPDLSVEGYPVVLTKRNPSDVNQQWGFSPTGHIYSLSKPNLVMTYIEGHAVTRNPSKPTEPSIENQEAAPSGLENLHLMSDSGLNEQIVASPDPSAALPDREEENPESVNLETSLAQLKDEYQGCRYSVVLLPKRQGDATQRWALKQEDFLNMGQWKNSTISNPEWNKRALSWPVNDDGTWNTDFTWPMEGFLLPYAPPVKKLSQKKGTITTAAPVRLKVLKNGESDLNRAVTVVGPDLTNMLHDVSGTSPNNSLKKHKRRSTVDKHAEQRGEEQTGSRHLLDLKKLELVLFLDRCTDAVHLPFAARKLFTKDGKELNSLLDLQRDELVYVSCGEPWSDPQMSHSEQQRRTVLANLAADISHIRQYCALRDPTDLVLQVDGAVTSGSRLCVSKCALSSEEREKLGTSQNDEEMPRLDKEDSLEDLYSHALNAHERSHVRAEHRLKTLRRPWENERTLKEDSSVDDKEDKDFDNELIFSDRQLQRKFRQQALRTQDTKPANPNQRQRWCFNNDGFISLKGTSLVLGLTESSNEGKSEVILCKKKLEDFTQRWVIAEDGFIYQRSNQQLVLTVTSPPLGNDSFAVDHAPAQGFEGASVVVAHRKSCANGNANQLWRFDSISGFIEAIAADTMNKEITAANKSNVCTYAVLGPQQVAQPGYVYMSGTSKETYLCEACGKCSRGRHKLQRLHQYHAGFACVLGTAQEQGLRLSGSFKCLNSKVDLSTLEAEATLDLWEHQMQRLRNESSVRTITRELHMAQSVPTVRIRAFKNGEGSRGQGEILIGSSIHALLDQCTVKLGLTSAARRLYTCCGELITDIQQLIRPYTSNVQQFNSNDAQQTDGVNVNNSRAEKVPNERLTSKGHAVDVVEAENQPLCRHQEKLSIDTQEREKELLDLEMLKKIHVSEFEGEEEEDIQSSGNVTYRVSEARTGSVPLIDLHDGQCFPRWDSRWPIDVWVSCGEPFVPLEDADKQYLLSMKHREERTWVQAYLDQEKHVLRQMQGRRMNMRSPPSSPRGVVLTPAWQEPTVAEEKKEETINELKSHLQGVKSRQSQSEASLRRPAKGSTQRLYSKPKTVRVYAVPNGETKQRAVVVFGGNMKQLLDACTSRLDLNSAARRLFTMDGDEITDFSEIKRDQYVSVSCGEGFLRARDRLHRQELKATWSRLNRQPAGSGPVTRSNVTFDNTILALPAPISPPPPSRVPPSPTRQVSIHRVSSRY